MNYESIIDSGDFQLVSRLFQNNQELLIVQSGQDYFILKKILNDEELILNEIGSSIEFLLNSNLYKKKSIYREIASKGK